jgi:hypothetical protein
METKKIKLSEYYQTYNEINGIIDPQTGNKIIPGLKDNKLTIPARFWLDELNTIITTEKTKIDKVRDELVTKYGEAGDNGSINIKMNNEDGSVNQKYIDFQNEINTFHNEEKEIQYTPLKLSDYANISTDVDYKMIFKFMVS